MNKEINICLSTDDNYIHHTATVVASVLSNAKRKDNYHFYILSTQLSDENKQKFDKLKKIKDCQIDYPELDEQSLTPFKTVKMHSHLTLAAFNRLLIPMLFPKSDKMIYLDSDLVVLSDIAELNNLKIGNAYFAGVLNPCADKLSKTLRYENDPYINSGIMIINCKALRQNNYLETLFAAVDVIKDKAKAGDQDFINYCFHKNIITIPSQWNVFLPFNFKRYNIPEPSDSDYILSKKKPMIIHFVGPQKPWLKDTVHPYKKEYLKYLQMTPWFEKSQKMIANLKEKRIYLSFLGIKIINYHSKNNCISNSRKSTLRLLGIPLLTIKKTLENKIFRFLGIRIAKIHKTPEKSILYFLGIRIGKKTNTDINFLFLSIKKKGIYRICTLLGIPFYFWTVKYTSRAQLPNNIAAIRKLKNKYKGKRCFIIGGSPSLNQLDLTKLNNEYTCTVGKGYKLVEKGLKHSTFHVFSDIFGYAESCRELDVNFSDTYFFRSTIDCVNAIKTPIFFDTYDSSVNPASNGFQTDLCKPLYCGCTVIIYALQIMAYLGFKKIYLIGVDLDFKTKDAHAYTSTKEEEERVRYSISSRQRMYDGLEFESNFLKMQKKQVINASAVKKLPFLKEEIYENLFE